jgi:putative iron-dependent peroxidase
MKKASRFRRDRVMTAAGARPSACIVLTGGPEMANAQPGIFAQGTRAHYHLEFDLPDVTPSDVSAAVVRLREPTVTVGGFNLVLGFGPALWERLSPGAAPVDFHAFEPIEGLDGKQVPATQHDLWVWVHGTGPDLALDAARAATSILSGVGSLAIEQPGFVYRDSRDLTGFIDGTENPPVQDAPSVALVNSGDPGAGGACAMTMRWIHDLDAFDRLVVADQERVFGRTKPDSIELDDAAKPSNAHIARVVIKEDGEELEIYRRSVPYGTVREHGLFFVAFSADPNRFDKMLARMFGTSGDLQHDHLTDFTRPVSGSYYFAPSLEALAALGDHG